MKNLFRSVLLLLLAASLLVPAAAQGAAPAQPAFSDVPATAWYAPYVHSAARRGLIVGVDGTAFCPEAPVTRAELTLMLWRLAGAPLFTSDPEFTAFYFTGVSDPIPAFCENALIWACRSGLLLGLGGTRLGACEPVTREQAVSILYRYALLEQIDVSVGEDMNILSYEDAFSISEYAIPAMQWACGAGLVDGNEGFLRPADVLTRAEGAKLLVLTAALVPGELI